MVWPGAACDAAYAAGVFVAYGGGYLCSGGEQPCFCGGQECVLNCIYCQRESMVCPCVRRRWRETTLIMGDGFDGVWNGLDDCLGLKSRGEMLNFL